MSSRTYERMVSKLSPNQRDTIKSVVFKLSPDQRDTIKSVLRKLNWYSPVPEQIYLEAVFENSPSVSFIQIGANDGADFVRNVVRRYHHTRDIKGVLVEPQPYFYRRLLSNYAGIEEIKILNFAISESAKSMTLYYIDYDSKGLPEWSKGLGSLSKQVLLSHRHLISNLDSYIRQMEVRCISVQDLIDTTGCAQLDVLVTDTEGYDLEILRQFDFASLRPKLIIYESKHLSSADFASCQSMLTGFGYEVTHLHNDNSVAVLL